MKVGRPFSDAEIRNYSRHMRFLITGNIWHWIHGSHESLLFQTAVGWLAAGKVVCSRAVTAFTALALLSVTALTFDETLQCVVPKTALRLSRDGAQLVALLQGRKPWGVWRWGDSAAISWGRVFKAQLQCRALYTCNIDLILPGCFIQHTLGIPCKSGA